MTRPGIRAALPGDADAICAITGRLAPDFKTIANFQKDNG